MFYFFQGGLKSSKWKASFRFRTFWCAFGLLVDPETDPSGPLIARTPPPGHRGEAGRLCGRHRSAACLRVPRLAGNPRGSGKVGPPPPMEWVCLWLSLLYFPGLARRYLRATKCIFASSLGRSLPFFMVTSSSASDALVVWLVDRLVG